jgi:hypothetical protein
MQMKIGVYLLIFFVFVVFEGPWRRMQHSLKGPPRASEILMLLDRTLLEEEPLVVEKFHVRLHFVITIK